MQGRLESSPTCLKESPGAESDFSTLDGIQEHFIRLYGRRNNVYLPGRTIRIELLHRGIADLNDSVRKGAQEDALERMHARIVSRAFCVAQGINNVSVAEGLRNKFPVEGCSYCHQSPCQCGEKRPSPDLGWGRDTSQGRWNLSDWQNHLNNLYAAKNKQRGIDYILNRLGTEAGELISLEHGFPHSMDEIEREYQLELADTLAWTIAAASYFGIDLERVTVEKYGKGCLKCNNIPCSCGPHDFQQVRVF